MLEIITGILGSGGFGSIVGLVGGYMNRKLDIEGKKLDLEDKEKERANALLRLDKEREYMKEEYNARLQIADKENVGKQIAADAVVDIAGYGAMEKSYDFAAPQSSDGWVDRASKLVRPLLTMLFLVFTGVVFWQVQKLVNALGNQPSAEQVFKLYTMVIEWIVFQAAVCIGWWFAMRPGKHPVRS